MKDTIRKIIKEADTSRYGGYYTGPLTMGEIDWDKSALGPFTKKVSNFFNADLQYDSYDGTLDSHKKDSKKLESKSKRISKYIKKHPQANDEDGGIINQTPGKGKKIVPIKEWIELDKINLNEDLAVWFGTKKKPKGSKQPKGPWVNICKKVDGKHPPCGRSNTDKGGYPKCRAAGVAGKMSDSEKKSACQQKRSAEKKDTQTGKGQKPIMTSYKKKKTNEDMKRIVRLTENDISRIVNKVLKEESTFFNFLKKKGNWRPYKETLPERTMATNDPNLQNEKYPEIYYGYDTFSRKSVAAGGNTRFGSVRYLCDSTPPRAVEFDPITANTGYGNPYENHNINMDSQRVLDREWLKPLCDQIKWKERKKGL